MNKLLSLVLGFSPLTIQAAQIPIKADVNGIVMLAATYPEDTDWICFKSEIVENVCAHSSELIPVTDGTFTIGGKKYNNGGSPIDAPFVAVKLLSLPIETLIQGVLISIRAGNESGITTYLDVFLVRGSSSLPAKYFPHSSLIVPQEVAP